MAGIDDDLVDLIKYFRGEQGNIILQGLQFVSSVNIENGYFSASMPELMGKSLQKQAVDYLLVLTIRPVAKHFSQSPMLISQFEKTIVVTVGEESHSANNQNASEVHSRAAIILVSRNHAFQYLDNLVPQLNVCPYVLQSQEQTG